MTRRKVAYVFTPIEFGGAERVTLNFLGNARCDSFDMIPIALVRPWEKDNFVLEKISALNLAIYTIPVALKKRDRGRDYSRILRCFLRLCFIIKTLNVDIIHTHGYFADIIGIPAAKLFSIPHIATCHGYVDGDWNLRLYNVFDRLTLRFSNKILAVSHEIRNVLASSGISHSIIKIVPNAIEMPLNIDQSKEMRRRSRSKLKIGDDSFVVGYIGRLSKEKGIEYLLQAIAEAVHDGLSVKCFIIGEGPERNRLEKMVHENGMTDKVRFTGFQECVHEWVPALDAFVLPSLTEGTPLALLEAMALGVPPIATRVGGVPEIIQSGVNGILVEPEDSASIRKAMILLCQNKMFRECISKNAKEHIIANYDLNNWVRQIEAEYWTLLNMNDRR